MTPRNHSGATRRDLVLVGGAWLLLVVVLSVWLAIDRRPPAWEAAGRLERAMRCADDLARGAWSAMLARGATEPPLVSCVAGAVYRLYPSDVAAAQAVILLALGLGMAATYVLARDLGGVGAAVPAAWMFGAAPLMIYSTLTFGPDVPLAASVAVALLALCRTDRLTRIAMSIVLGVLLGVGMLVKPAFALYLVGPVLWLLALERSWRAAFNLLVAIVIAAAISLPWYGPRVLLPAVTAPPTVRATVGQYAAALLPQLGVLTTGLVVVGIVLAALHARGFAIVALVVPLALVALGGVDRATAALPLLPAAAVLAGMAIAALPGPARLAGLLLVALVGAVQLSGVTWAVPKAIALPVLDVPWVVASPPSSADWRQRDVLRAIANDSGGRPLTIGVLPDDAAFSASNFRYYALRDRLPFRVVGAWETDPVGIDYVVLKTGDVGARRTAQASRAAEQLARDPALARAYPVLGDFPLPDGSTASVRVRRITDGVATAPDALASVLESAIRRQLSAVARDVDNLTLGVEHDAELVRGRVKRIELSADSAIVRDHRRVGRELDALDASANELGVVLAAEGEVVDVARLRMVRAEVSGDDIQAFLAQLKAFRRTRVRLTSDAVYVTARQPGADVSAVLRPVPAADGRVTLRVERAAIGWVPLPTALVNWLVRDYDPAGRLTAALPFAVEVASVVVTEHAVRVGD